MSADSLYQRSRFYRWLFWHRVPFIRDDAGFSFREQKRYADHYMATGGKPPTRDQRDST